MFAGILDNFVVFEGGDGSGTSTQLALLRQKFEAERPGPALHATAEPTGGPVGRLIRLALRGEPALRPETLAGLFAADRNEHLHAPGGVRERCLRGELVVCDRYVLSSLAYQGAECGEELPRRLNRGFPAPALVLFFDLDPAEAERRMAGRGELDIFENLGFQRRVRERYLALLGEARAAGVRVGVVDASRPPEKVALDVWGAVSKMPIMSRGSNA